MLNNRIGYLHFWCQKVLPLVYDNSLSYLEVLYKVKEKLNEVIKFTNDIPEYIDKKFIEAFDEEHLKELISEVFRTIEDAISANNEGANTHFSTDYPTAGILVWHDNKLYKTMHPIDSGDAILPDSNIEIVNFGDMFNEFLVEVKTRFTDNDDEDRKTSSADRPIHDLVWLNNELYEVIKPIAEGNAYIYSGTNKNVDSTNLDKIYDYLLDLISSEIETREEADTTLQHNIDDEATARSEADTTLQHNIDDEATARNEADIILQNNIDAVASLNRIYKSISEMVADTTLTAGKCVICCTPYESRWEITTSVTPDLVNRTLSNGLNAKLLNNIPINIGSLKNYNTNDDISSDLSFLLSNGYKDIIIPQGIFRCSITVPANSKIKGSGKTITGLIPVNHGTCFNLDGDYIQLSDLSINDVAPYTGYGISVSQSLGSSNSHFENLHIENTRIGFIATSSMIWNEFTNCDFIGCMDSGFVLTSATAYFNNNSFYSCKFNNNVNYGINIDVAEVHDYANVFYSCNIEYNAHDRFGITRVVNNAVNNTGFTSFIGCYFEGNGSANTDSTIINFDLLNLQGCIFVQDRILVDNTNPSITNFIGCKQYQCVGYVKSTTNVNQLGNNFTIS